MIELIPCVIHNLTVLSLGIAKKNQDRFGKSLYA